MPKTKRKYGLLTIAILIGGTLALSPLFAKADPLDDYTAKEKQLADKGGQVKSLTDEMKLLDDTIAAKTTYLAGVKVQSEKIRAELRVTNAELQKMQSERDRGQGKLNEYVRTDYVDGSPSAYFVLASAGSLSAATSKSSYVEIFKNRTDTLVNRLDTLERRQTERQRDVISHVQQLDSIESEATRQTQELEAIRQAKERLLTETKGQEDEFRKQYETARDQLTKLGIFGRAACARIGAHEWVGAPGYFNQCDSRWANVKLGFSDSSTLGDFGCGVTVLAMVFEHYGIDTDPARLNSDLKRVGGFWDDLLIWGNTGGASQGRLNVTAHSGIDWGAVDQQLAGGNPVIVFIDRGSTSHYVELISRDGSTYRMNDPVEGPNLRFSDFYSTGAVYQYITFSPK